MCIRDSIGNHLLQLVEELLFLRSDVAIGIEQVVVLFGKNGQQGTRGRGQQDQPGNFAGMLRDAWRQHAALAVAQYVDPVWIDARRGAQRSNGGHGIVGGLSLIHI